MSRFGINLLWVAKREYEPNHPLVAHTHTGGVYHYIYVIKGEGWIRIGEQFFDISVGQVYLTAPDVEHAFFSSNSAPLVTVELKFEIPDRELDERMRTMPLILDGKDEGIGKLIWDIWEEKTEGRLFYPQIQEARMYELMCRIQRQAVMEQYADPHGWIALQPVLHYMNDHITEPLDLEELAQIAHLERVYFSKKFKRVMGISPMEYVRNAKVEKAKDWMATTDKSITQIAQELGFQTLQHFSAVFQKSTGISPSQYKRTVKHQ